MTDPIEIARLFLFVREAGQNTGQRVEAIQKWCGGQAGESWCAYFATMVLDLAFQGAAPIPRQGSCQAIHELAHARGWLTDTPNVGDLFLRLHPDTGVAHHVGFITRTGDPLGTIAGNTSADGLSSNGDRVAEHDMSPAANTVAFVAYPR